MKYMKNLFKSLKSIFIYFILSYLIIFILFIFYNLMGYNNINKFILNYASYGLIIFNIVYIIFLFKKNYILIKHNRCMLPFMMLGIGFSCFCNMIIMKLNTKNIVEMNIWILILSSVLIGPLVEEILFRNILIKNLEKFNGKIVTILLASIIFAIFHFGIYTIIYTFLFAIILNVIYIKSKNLIYSLVIHSSGNLIALFLEGYNDYILLLSFILLIISVIIVKKDYLLK